jgi:hypothetical protein
VGGIKMDILVKERPEINWYRAGPNDGILRI